MLGRVILEAEEQDATEGLTLRDIPREQQYSDQKGSQWLVAEEREPIEKQLPVAASEA